MFVTNQQTLKNILEYFYSVKCFVFFGLGKGSHDFMPHCYSETYFIAYLDCTYSHDPYVSSFQVLGLQECKLALA